MTLYNNKPYRIDDLNFDLSPKDQFELRNGDKISFVEYMRKHYSLEVREPERQAMLLSMPPKPKKEQQKRSGQADRDQKPVLLVPEFCFIAGPALLKQFENDFSAKNSLNAITKLNPDQRHEMLRTLMRTVKEDPRSSEELAHWKMEFDDEVLKVPATLLKTVEVHFANVGFLF